MASLKETKGDDGRGSSPSPSSHGLRKEELGRYKAGNPSRMTKSLLLVALASSSCVDEAMLFQLLFVLVRKTRMMILCWIKGVECGKMWREGCCVPMERCELPPRAAERHGREWHGCHRTDAGGAGGRGRRQNPRESPRGTVSTVPV